jgi:hypothetical protein
VEDAGLELVGEAARQQLEHHIAHPHCHLRRAAPVALVCRRNASRRQVAHVSARLRLVRMRLQLLAAAHKQPHKRPAVACAHGACSPESETEKKKKRKRKRRTEIVQAADWTPVSDRKLLDSDSINPPNRTVCALKH